MGKTIGKTNPLGDPTESDIEEANAPFNLLDQDEVEDDFVDSV